VFGVWGLAYFNLRRIRVLFVANDARGPQTPVLLAPIIVAKTPTVSSAPKRSAVEILLICLAVLYLYGSMMMVVCAILRFPLFLPGFVFRGTAASVSELVFATIILIVGIGLLRRMKFAWFAAVILNAFGLVYNLAMFFPHNRALMAGYQQEITRSMYSGTLDPATNQMMNQTMNQMLGPIYVFSAVIGILMVGAVLWLLFLARPLFEPKRTVS
jgi:hypothetical protein